MGKSQTEWVFNFGPIARTDAGGTHNTFNLASLPLHVMLDALMAATNRDEFVAWLWHDLFKPAFYWVSQSPGKFSWIHIPGLPPFESSEAQFAKVTEIPTGLVRAHQGIPKSLQPTFSLSSSEQKLKFSEGQIIEDQFDQIGLGREARFIQLAFAVEPAMSTALVRAVIAESFVEAVTKSVARELIRTLGSKTPTFTRVRFVFGTTSNPKFSTSSTDSEIWNQVGQKYNIQPVDDELVIRHLTPVELADGFATEVVVDLTGAVPTPEQMLTNTLGLAELLIVYQDDRTILMTVPQLSIYPLDINGLKKETLSLARTKLSELDVLTTGESIDLLDAVFVSQIMIREVPNRLPIPPSPHISNKSPHLRPIDQVVAYPRELLSQAATGGRRCRVCGSAFESNLSLTNDWPGHDFTDTEHIGVGGDLCPLCLIYTINNHKSRTAAEKVSGVTGDRKSMRGSFALILPSSHFDVRDGDCRLVERPPLDLGGRFDLDKTPLQRVTVTQQEYALFNQMSRRVIAGLWQKIEPTAALPLPYLGGILLTHREAGQVRRILPAMRELFASVKLSVYPFEVKVTPGVEIALDVVLTDFKQHHTKHTYLKSRASIVPIHPDSRLSVLADNKLQIELNRDWFEAYDRTAEFVSQIVALQRSERGRRISNREKFKRIMDDERAQPGEWMSTLVGGDDPATAFYESALTRMTRGDDTRAFNITADFWKTQFGQDPTQAWSAYEQKRDDLRDIFARYPMLTKMFSALTERKEKEDDNNNTTTTDKEANGASTDRGSSRRGGAGTAKRARTRSQTGG